MCGIVGVVRTERGSGDEDVIARAVGCLHHRGPDARAVRAFDGPGMGAVLGHTRLRIIDLSPEADQPLANEDETVWVVYNGELYDEPEQRRRLEAAGHRFRSRTDTEVLVHLYEEHVDEPEAMLRELRGMFGFAIVDVVRGRVLIARDRLGIKPMYWTEFTDGIAFASEVRALMEAGFVGPRADPTLVGNFLLWGHTRTDASFFPDVRELGPGEALVWNGGAAKVSRWWHPNPDPVEDVGEEAVRFLRATLDDAVRRHLVADRPVGVFLSGGVDSGAVATLAARTGDVRTFTVAFPEEPHDEAAAAAETARRLGVANDQVPITGGDVAAALPDILASMDRPTADGINTWLVCRAAHDAGLVVALSGLGGDELFGGYPSFTMVPSVARAAPVLAAAGRSLREGLGAAIGRSTPGGRWARVVGSSPGFEGAYMAVRGQFSPAELRSARIDVMPRVQTGGNGAPASDGDRVMLLELSNYMPEQLLRDTDQMSMAHSMEVRVPLLDDAVVRVAMAVPASVRLRAGKALLAEAAGVHVGPKQPFALPFDRWMRGALRETAREGLLSETLPFAREIPAVFRARLWDAFERERTHWSRPWTVAVLRLWAARRDIRVG